MRKIKTV